MCIFIVSDRKYIKTAKSFPLYHNPLVFIQLIHLYEKKKFHSLEMSTAFFSMIHFMMIRNLRKAHQV